MQERVAVGEEIELVSDQDVLRRLADPGEVLELVCRQDAVGAGERASLGEERGEDDHREARQGDQHAQLEAVDRQPVEQPVEARALRARGELASTGPSLGQAAHSRDATGPLCAAESPRRTRRPTWRNAASGPFVRVVSAAVRTYWARSARRITPRRTSRRGNAGAASHQSASGRVTSLQRSDGATAAIRSRACAAGVAVVEQLAAGGRERLRVAGRHGAAETLALDEVA